MERVLLTVALVAVAAAVFVLRATTTGRYVLAVGGNAAAARLAGVPVRQTLVTVYAASALLSGIAGLIVAARLGASDAAKIGQNMELDAIAAVVVGGTSLFGGRGGIGNTIIGLLVLGVLNNGLDHVQIDSFLKILIRGLILLSALIINVYAQRLKESE